MVAIICCIFPCSSSSSSIGKGQRTFFVLLLHGATIQTNKMPKTINYIAASNDIHLWKTGCLFAIAMAHLKHWAVKSISVASCQFATGASMHRSYTNKQRKRKENEEKEKRNRKRKQCTQCVRERVCASKEKWWNVVSDWTWWKWHAHVMFDQALMAFIAWPYGRRKLFENGIFIISVLDVTQFSFIWQFFPCSLIGSSDFLFGSI